MKVGGVTAECLASLLRESEQGASLEVYARAADAEVDVETPAPKRRRDAPASDARRGGHGGAAGGATWQLAAGGAPQMPAAARAMQMARADEAAGAAAHGASVPFDEPPLVSKRAAAALVRAAAASAPPLHAAPPLKQPAAAPLAHAARAGAAGASRAAPAGFFTIQRLGGEQHFHNCAALEAALQEGDVASLRGTVRGPLALTQRRVLLTGAMGTTPTLAAPRGAMEPTLRVQADGVSVCALAIDVPASRPTTRQQQLSAVEVAARVTEFILEDVTITGEDNTPTKRSACPEPVNNGAVRTKRQTDGAMRMAPRVGLAWARRGRVVRQLGRGAGRSRDGLRAAQRQHQQRQRQRRLLWVRFMHSSPENVPGAVR
jgi:hypothetical protein